MINLEKIRNMDDEQLSNYLKSLTNKNKNYCVKCGKTGEFTLFVKNIKEYQQKKLCSLCKNCYNELLKQLEMDDIIWD